MVRLTTVISDNWNKGSMLAEKLEGESGSFGTAGRNGRREGQACRNKADISPDDPADRPDHGNNSAGNDGNVKNEKRGTYENCNKQ